MVRVSCGSLFLVPHLVQGAVVRIGFARFLHVVWVDDVCFVDDPRLLLRCVLIG